MPRHLEMSVHEFFLNLIESHEQKKYLVFIYKNFEWHKLCDEMYSNLIYWYDASFFTLLSKTCR